MKVSLINPRTSIQISDTVFPPLGLMYLSAAIRAGGHEASISDQAFSDMIPPDADVYGITGTSPQAAGMGSLLRTVRTMNPRARVIAGGPHASLAPEEVLSWGFDAVIAGEGELAIKDVLERPWTGVIIADRIQHLDDLPFPDRRQVERYRYYIDGLLATMMMSSRGCPHACAFCSKPMGSTPYLRSVASIMTEVRAIQKDGYRAIMFVDDTMGLDPGRLIRLSVELGRAKVTWRCLLRANQVTPELAQSIAIGGCVEVGIGVESGSDRILENIQKGVTVAEAERAIRHLHEAGVRVKGFFIIGLPGETRESLAETEAFLERVPVDDIDICILGVYRGSPISNHPDRYDLQANGRATYYKADPKRYSCSVSTSQLSAEDLLQARAHLERRFKRWR